MIRKTNNGIAKYIIREYLFPKYDGTKAQNTARSIICFWYWYCIFHGLMYFIHMIFLR